jgi:hypothetical protein
LQTWLGGNEGPAVFSLELGRNTKEGMNETLLPDYIALRRPPNLPFPDQMHRLVTIDRPQGTFRRPEPQTRCNPFLYESMVLLNGVGTERDSACSGAGNPGPWADPRCPRISDK